MDAGASPREGLPGRPAQEAGWWWFHIILTAYGAWLYGDARGFRTRHHCEHVEGDYKSPPPAGRYADQEARSRKSLKHEPVSWPPEWRAVIGGGLVARLQHLGAFVLCAPFSRQHAHILAKVPRREARAWTGLAKRHAWFIARAHGWVGKMWGTRGKQEPVRDRWHQVNAYRCILDHEKEGAWVCRWKKVE